MKFKKIKTIASALILSVSFLSIKAQPINPQPGENIWHLISSIGTEIDTLAACAASSISSQTTIANSGNYCLTQSFTGNIIIDAPNTVLDLNGRDVTGRITASAPYCTIKNGTIFAPASRQNRATREGAIIIEASNISIVNCVLLGLTATSTFFINGSSGVVDDFSDVAPITRDNITIEKCRIIAGQGYSTATDFAGSGGYGVSLNGNNNLITQCFVQGGSGGSSDMNQAGFGYQAFTSFNGNNMIIDNSVFVGGDSGTGNAGASAGDGVYVPQTYFLFTNCTFLGGTGLDNASGDGNFGGKGCVLGNGSQGGVIQDSFISGGNGGAGGKASPDTGGDGGEAIRFLGNSANIKIKNCTVLASGNGGDGFNAGNGADGIHIINSLPSNIEITHCSISNTGIAGTPSGGAAGTAGKAINDENTNFNSIIFSNFAYDIADTSTQYVIRNSGTAMVSNGISAYSTSPVPNFLDNVFVP